MMMMMLMTHVKRYKFKIWEIRHNSLFTSYIVFPLSHYLNTLKKKGRAFRNIGKYNPILFNQPCLFLSIIQLIAV